MRQILQSVKDGETLVCDVPSPQVGRGRLLIRTRTTLISAGTERMLVEFGKAGWLDKARQQPDKVRQVLDRIKTDGLFPTLEAVSHKLNQPIPLGYCNVGTVLEVGSDVEGFEPGDRVLSNGPHAEVVSVPKNLCARIPEGVSDEAAVFGVIGATGLEGIRLAQPTLGEAFVVSGLGIVGLITAQLLSAHGCRVLGLDFDRRRLAHADESGIETFNLSLGDPIPAAMAFSRGRGVDAVLITAATKSDAPVRQAAQMCRKRGRLILVGVAGLHLSRADFYEKELSFQVSCSYGPGRYDAAYEQQGHDYPLGFVRWTEQRNFEAVLDMMEAGRIDPESLISHRFDLDEAAEAYRLISSEEPSLGVLLQYPRPQERDDTALLRTTVPGERPTRAATTRAATTRAATTRAATTTAATGTGAAPRVAFLGTGGHATQKLIPAFQEHGARLSIAASRTGLSAAIAGRKFGFGEITSDIDAPFENPDIDAIVVATRHDSHADLACRALDAGKHVFVEKPLALNTDQLEEVLAAARGSSRLLMVGFNRRFAPHIRAIRRVLVGAKEAKAFIMTLNAGMIPADHWVHDPIAGGGRIIGEGCHFVDLLRFLCGSSITSVQAARFGRAAADDIRDDRMTFTLSFADGSIGTVHYLANGHKAIPKERLEIFCGGRVIQLDNFRRLRAVGWAGLSKMNLWKQDKGHSACAEAFLKAIREGGPPPIPLDELAEVTRVTFDAVRAAENRETIRYDKSSGVNNTDGTTETGDRDVVTWEQTSLAD